MDKAFWIFISALRAFENILPLFLASFLFDKKLPINAKQTAISIFFILACFLSVYIQPDLGTGLLIAASGFLVLFLAGLSWVFIGITIAAILIFSPSYGIISLNHFRDRIWTLLILSQTPMVQDGILFNQKLQSVVAASLEKVTGRAVRHISTFFLKHKQTLFFLFWQRSLDLLVYYYCYFCTPLFF